MPAELHGLNILPWEDVSARATHGDTAVWASARARALLAPEWPAATWLEEGGAGAEALGTIIVIGGGTLIDHVKRRRRTATSLIAVPTLWGSGAEASSVAVWTEDGKKKFRLDPALRPDAIGFELRFAATVTPAQARAACGDVWSHALEGFLSPLADDVLRTRLAALMTRLLELPIAADGRWFEPGAEAAALQARASVGLVHGLAHTLEPAIAAASGPALAAGHADLCALLLAPVLRWNAATSPKWAELSAGFGLDRARIEATVEALGDPARRRALIPAIEASWRQVLRDPCTRTNSALVRPDSLAGVCAEVGR